MNAIELKGMVFFAYHGVLEQERKVGNTFTIDLHLFLDLSQAAFSDKLEDTVNYASVYELVKTEMEQPSNLLEHAAGKIIMKIKETYPQILRVGIRLSKKNPPVGGDIQEAAVILEN